MITSIKSEGSGTVASKIISTGGKTLFSTSRIAKYLLEMVSKYNTKLVSECSSSSPGKRHKVHAPVLVYNDTLRSRKEA